MRGSWIARSLLVLGAAVPLAVVGLLPSGAQTVAAGSTRGMDVQAPRLTIESGAGLNAITAISPSNIWAVGSWGNRNTNIEGPLVMHFNGTKWTQVATPMPASSLRNAGLQAIAVASPSSIWAAGLYPLEGPFAGETPYVLHFNGKAWTRVHTPAIAGVRLWSAADVGSNAWFGGDRGQNPIMLHLAGSSWSVMRNPLPESTILGMAATSATSVWTVSTGANGGAITHWTGATWHIKTLASLHPSAFAMGKSGPEWLVGSTGPTNSTPFAAHWTGKSWQVAPQPSLGTSAMLDGICVAPDGSAWAVGDDGNFQLAILHWTGKAWVRMAVPAFTGAVTGCAALSATSVWAVTNASAHPLHWNGKVWTVTK